jgi:polysaccharide pyruvyl transferase WcaK-like protein
MTQVSKPVRIGIFGHYGNVNMGDEAITSATIHQLRQRLPDCELIGFSLNPAATLARHGIPTYPIRRTVVVADRVVETDSESVASAPSGGLLRRLLKRIPLLYPLLRGARDLALIFKGCVAEIGFLRQAYRQVKGLNLLIVAGSNQVEDTFDGPFSYPYTLWKWGHLARLAGVPLVYASVGASPMSSRISRFFCRRALLMASYRSFRDHSSKKIIEGLGVVGDNFVFPDLAYGFPLAPATVKDRTSRKLVVAINPLPFQDERYWPKADVDQAGYEQFVDKLVQFCVWLQGLGHSVVLFPTQLTGDPLVAADIVAAIRKSSRADGAIPPIVEVRGFDELSEVIRSADLIVATRFHAILLGHLAYQPVVALSYQKKIDDLMAASAQGALSLPIRTFTLEQLKQVFEQASQRLDECRQEIVVQTDAKKTQVADLFDTLVKFCRKSPA